MTISEHDDTAQALQFLPDLLDWRTRNEAEEYQFVFTAAWARFRAGEADRTCGPATAAVLASSAGNGFWAAMCLGHYEQALTFAEHEWGYAQRAASVTARAKALSNRGSALQALGQLARAESDFRTALEVLDQSGLDTPEVSGTRGVVANNYGSLLHIRGETTRAKELLTHAVQARTEFAPGSLRWGDEAGRLNNQASVYSQEKQYDQAAATLHHAEEVARREGVGPQQLGIIICNLGEAYFQAGVYEAAIRHLKRALELHESDAGFGQQLALTCYNLGLAYQMSGQHELAAATLKRAWETLKNSAPRSVAALSILHRLGLARFYEGDYRRARSVYERGMQLYEEIRPEVAASESGHEGTLSAYRNLVNHFLYLSMHQEWPDEVFDLIERAKARFWLEALTRSARKLNTDPERPHKDVLNDLTYRDGLVLNFFVGHDAVFVAYRRGIDFGAYRIEITADELTRRCRAARRRVADSPGHQGQSARGGRTLKSEPDGGRESGPVEDLGLLLFGTDPEIFRNVRHILILPDGPLWYVPLESLRVPEPVGQYLGAVAPVSVSASAGVSGMLRRRERRLPERTEWSFLVVACPSFGSGYPPIPGTLREAEQLCALLNKTEGDTPVAGKVTCLVQNDATPAKVLECLERATHIHLAAHAFGELNENEPFVLLCDGAGGPAKFTVSEIEGCELRADLVFLSACATSLGRVSVGEGLTSLARAFLLAGARSVVATLWPVDDAETVAFVEAFYLALDRGLSVARAAKVGREAFQASGGSEAVWAAFQVLGDGDLRADRWGADLAVVEQVRRRLMSEDRSVPTPNEGA